MKLLAIIFFAVLAGVLAFLFLFYLAFRAFILWVKFMDWLGALFPRSANRNPVRGEIYVAHGEASPRAQPWEKSKCHQPPISRACDSRQSHLSAYVIASLASLQICAHAQSLPWTEDLFAPDPSVMVAAVQTAPAQAGILPRRPPLPRRLELTWSNAMFAIGAEIVIASNPPALDGSPTGICADSNVLANSSVLFTNLPWGRIYFFDRSIPVTNMPYLVEGPIGYAGSFSGFQNLPALFQGDTLIKWLTNEPDGPSHFYSGPGLTARIIPVPMP